MGYRRFDDTDGEVWEVRDRSRSEWDLQPVSGSEKAVTVPSPGYEADPFELSVEELQRLLDGARGTSRGSSRKSPFKD
jgi:hypothetical protein